MIENYCIYHFVKKIYFNDHNVKDRLVKNEIKNHFIKIHKDVQKQVENYLCT
jgi:hypothetical protein